MSSPPGRGHRPAATARGWLVRRVVVLIAAVAWPRRGRHRRAASLERLLPADRGDRAKAHEIRDLYTSSSSSRRRSSSLVEGLIIWSVIRYRRKPGDDTLPPQTHGNNVAELVWTIVPTIIVDLPVRHLVADAQQRRDRRRASPSRKIRAVAGQFQWQFDYLADATGPTILYTQYLPAVAEGGGMAVPAGRTVQLDLTSHDVIHAFYVPQFLFKRDVVPGSGQPVRLHGQRDDAGQTFRGQCAELCGTGHRIMLFDVHALTAGRLRRLAATREDRRGQRDAHRPRPSGVAAGRPVHDQRRKRRRSSRRR